MSSKFLCIVLIAAASSSPVPVDETAAASEEGRRLALADFATRHLATTLQMPEAKVKLEVNQGNLKEEFDVARREVLNNRRDAAALAASNNTVQEQLFFVSVCLRLPCGTHLACPSACAINLRPITS